MPEPLRVTAVLQARGPAAAVLLTEEQVEAIAGGPKTPPVRVTVNGGHTFAGRVGRMKGEILLGFNKAVRDAVGVRAGDELELEIVHDDAPREVELPAALAGALAADPAARSAFDALSFSRRKELARGIADAKRDETREKRLAAAMEGLRGA